MSTHAEFEAVIGLEVHCQLATDTKIFCGCRARTVDGKSVADVDVNSNTCPVCTGQPGALPVLNKKAVEYAVKAGLATHCRINLRNIFARKNYFYPDSPKGYQISQFETPICEHGWLNIETKAGGPKRIPIQRIHMEEDAGKSIHHSGFSVVNLNRACVPLIEIVSGPDMRSAEEAGAYLRALHSVVTYIEVTDGNMQEGNFRCDANVSVMPKGSTVFGTRTEIKNVNSFRFVEKAIEYEIARQIQVIKSGGKIVQETRTFDDAKGITISLRSKEEAHDYRYFPDPDLIPVMIEEAFVEKTKAALPELPEQKRGRFVSDLGLSAYDAGVLTASRELAGFFEASVKKVVASGVEVKVAAKSAANYITGEVARLLNDAGAEIQNTKLKPDHIADIVTLSVKNIVSSTGAKQIVTTVWKTGEDVNSVVEREGLKQVSDASALEPVVDKVIAANEKQVQEYRSGKDKLLGFFVGQVMKETGGKANPAMLQELVKKKLST